MTEERKKYLANISKEERVVRLKIHRYNNLTKYRKLYLTMHTEETPSSLLDDARESISNAKIVIKVLKKQLPAPTKLHKNEFLDFCSCSSCGWGVDFEQPYCQKCGQKLR